MDPATHVTQGLQFAPGSDNQGLSPFFLLVKCQLLLSRRSQEGAGISLRDTSVLRRRSGGITGVPAPRLAGVCGLEEEMVEARLLSLCRNMEAVSSIPPGCEVEAVG